MGEPAVFIGVSSNEDAEVAQLVSPAHTRPVAGGRRTKYHRGHGLAVYCLGLVGS